VKGKEQGAGSKEQSSKNPILHAPCSMLHALYTRGKMNKKGIIEAIHEKVGFSKRETKALVDGAFELLKTALDNGEPVMVSAFGKFSVQHRKARKGRNPRTGESTTIPARNVVTFKASRVLKEQINEAHRDRDTRKAVFQDR
jgi:integration host factor subunit alpha